MTTGPQDRNDTTQPVWYAPSGEPGRSGPPPGAGSPAPDPWHGAPAPAYSSPAPARRGAGRWAELGTVAVLAALLASGGTYAATELADDAGSPTAAGEQRSEPRGTDAAPVRQADPSSPDWAATAGEVSPSVVAISVRGDRGSGQGSGVVIDEQGHIVTNNHVVASAARGGEIAVTLNDGRAFPAEIAGTDPSTDLAVITLKDPPQDLRPIALGDSEALKVGDPVMAVGNPLGLAGTVTTGIVSALNRPVTTSAEGGRGGQAEPVVTNAIQTSAAINPGNSGGALVNASGQLVGINSSIATLGGGSGGQGGNIGIGFAIPVKEARSIASQLIEKGSAEHAFLGVSSQDGTAAEGGARRTGAEIRTVQEGTAADKAGLRPGDTVVAVDGELVDSSISLVAHIRERTVGDTVTLTVLRDGTKLDLKATLGARPDGQR
jgi:putative serine protease PepD